jgi:hypothetical protein
LARAPGARPASLQPLTHRAADLAYFDGSHVLRAGLGAGNRCVFGQGTEAVEALDAIETRAEDA